MHRLKKNIYFSLILLGIIPSAIIGKADTIVLKNATNLEVYNVEEAGKWILYTTEDNLSAPLQRISISEVFAIRIGDGELRMIEPQASNTSATPVQDNVKDGEMPIYKEAVASKENSARISAYNSPVLKLKKPKEEKDKEKFCSDFLTIWGIEDASIISDNNIDVDFIMTIPDGPKKSIMPQYKIKVTNKTVQPIYIDLANSFKFSADGTARPYYTNSVYQEGGSSSHGASLNLGRVAGALGIGGPVGILANGIGIGKSSSKTAAISTTEERILMIPPKGSVFMPPMKYADGSTLREDYETLYIRTYPIGGPLTSDGDYRRYDGNKGFVHSVDQEGGVDDARLTRDVIKAPMGWIREFSETDSPKRLKRLFTYSTSPTFSSYTCLDFTLYVRGVMGSNQQWNVPRDYDKTYLECDDENHLIVGIGMVKKK